MKTGPGFRLTPLSYRIRYYFFVSGAAPLGDAPPLAVAPVLAGSSFFFVSAVAPGLAGGVAGVAAVPLDAELDAPGLAGGVAGVAVLPPEAAPLGLDGEVLLGEELELDEPGVDEVLLLSPLSHAASPKASATAAAKIESFMCPPRLGYRTGEQGARPA